MQRKIAIIVVIIAGVLLGERWVRNITCQMPDFRRQPIPASAPSVILSAAPNASSPIQSTLPPIALTPADHIANALTLLQIARRTAARHDRLICYRLAYELLQSHDDPETLGAARNFLLAYCETRVNLDIIETNYRLISEDRLQFVLYQYLFEEPGVFDQFVDYYVKKVNGKINGSDMRQELFHQVASGFFTYRRVTVLRRHLDPYLSNIRGQLWADIGTGLGVGLVLLAEATGQPPIAQDIAPELEPFWVYLGKKMPELRNIKTVIGTGNRAGLDPRSVDGVTMHDVHMGPTGIDDFSFDGVAAGIAWLKPIRRAIRPGGQVIITETAADNQRVIAYSWMLKQAGLVGVESVQLSFPETGSSLTILTATRP